jgi:serine/threonine protein kinase
MLKDGLFDDRYKILRVLGCGGMGTVYLAENCKLGTLWAIKCISKSGHASIDRTVEPNILKKLHHPALPRIFDILEDEDNIYIIVDYIEGTPLNLVLERDGRFPEATVLEWAREICQVLAYLHGQKPNPVIYRDMKPSNIILTPEGSLKLIDFGIAREYKASSESDTIYIGTRGYAAPEQYGSGQSNAATDIYSLGITLYQLLTGKSPNEPPYEIKPVRFYDKGLSTDIEQILLKCTRQDPSERYQSVQELLAEMINMQNSSKSPLSAPTPTTKQHWQLPEDYKKAAGFVGDASCGVTTMVTAVSEYFASAGRKVAVVDLTRSLKFFYAFGEGYSRLYPQKGEAVRTSLKSLVEGHLKPIPLDKNRNFFLSDTPVEIDRHMCADIVDLLNNDHDIVLFAMDFSTSPEWIRHLHHLLLVKDMDLYRLKSTVEYIGFLKEQAVNLSKLQVIINKYVKSSVKPNVLVDALAVRKPPGGDTYEALLNRDIPYHTVFFDPEGYRLSVESTQTPCFSCRDYSQVFLGAISRIGDSIYPVYPKKGVPGFLEDIRSKWRKKDE